MSTIFVNGVPVRSKNLSKKSRQIKSYGEPCSYHGCKQQPTQKYETTIQEETKLLPLCSLHKDLI